MTRQQYSAAIGVAIGIYVILQIGYILLMPNTFLSNSSALRILAIFSEIASGGIVTAVILRNRNYILSLSIFLILVFVNYFFRF